MTFHAPHLLWLLALAAPLIAVWFLKLKRPRVTVPSLALWVQVAQDQRVNAPFQRLRRQIPLYLQLLALLGLVLAAAQPFIQSGQERGARTVLLVDVSASMGARAVAGGPTRLEAALAEVRAVVDGLGGGRQVAVVAVGSEARRLTAFTDDRRELHAALATLASEAAASDLDGALGLVTAMARADHATDALLYTDANLPDQTGADLPLTLRVMAVPPGGANLGLTALSARRRIGGGWQVLAVVKAGAQGGGGARMVLEAGGSVVGERHVSLEANGSERVTLHLDGGSDTVLTARIEADGFDALALDDRASLPLPATRPLAVWIDPELTAWRKVLSAQGEVRLFPGDSAAPLSFDLVVAQHDSDLARSAPVRFGDGAMPAGLGGILTVDPQGAATVTDWRRTDPLLAYVVLDDLLVASAVQWQRGQDEDALNRAGWEVLVHGDTGPLMVRRSGAAADYRLLVPSARSTLPWRVGFPVMAGNLALLARQAAGQADLAARPTGPLPTMSLGANATVTAPDAAATPLRADADGLVAGIAADRPGVWRLRGADRDESFGVALLSPQETSLAAHTALRFNEVAIDAQASLPAEQRWWPWLAMLALIALVLEWWWVHRQAFGRARLVRS